MAQSSMSSVIHFFSGLHKLPSCPFRSVIPVMVIYLSFSISIDKSISVQICPAMRLDVADLTPDRAACQSRRMRI
jgi:hypothetical protein